MSAPRDISFYIYERLYRPQLPCEGHNALPEAVQSSLIIFTHSPHNDDFVLWTRRFHTLHPVSPRYFPTRSHSPLSESNLCTARFRSLSASSSLASTLYRRTRGIREAVSRRRYQTLQSLASDR